MIRSWLRFLYFIIFCLYLFYQSANWLEKLCEEEIHGDTEEKSYHSEEMLGNKEDQKHQWCRDFEWLSDYTGIQEIALDCMDYKQHQDKYNNDAPSWIFDDAGKKDRNTTDENTKNGDKTGEKCDTSESQ